MRVGTRSSVGIVAAMLGIAVVVGCSASGGDGAVDDTTPTEPAAPAPATLPPASSAPADVDASKPPPPKDGGKDSAVDAGPPPPVPGTSCSTVDEVKKKKCGACGEQSTICLGTGGDAGSGTWSEYGPCSGELAGGCIPGTTVTESCGNCGTRTKTCSQYCAYSAGTCAGEPVSSCVPGSVDLSNAGCSTTSTYHQRTCSSTCTYANYGLTCDPAPTTIAVGPTVGNVTSTIVSLVSTQTTTRLGGTCPAGTLSAATTVTPYAYIKVHNPNAKSVVVSVYDTVAPGGVVFPTILASYGAATPTTDVQRKACVKGVNDFGDDALTGDSDLASLSDTDAVTIPANGTVTIYNAAYNKASSGKVKLNVRVERFN